MKRSGLRLSLSRRWCPREWRPLPCDAWHVEDSEGDAQERGAIIAGCIERFRTVDARLLARLAEAPTGG